MALFFAKGEIGLAMAAQQRRKSFTVPKLYFDEMFIIMKFYYGMHGVVKDDHRFYKERGLYDFPQRDLSKQAFNVFMGVAFMFESVRLQAFERMPAMYIQQHKRIVESGEP